MAKDAKSSVIPGSIPLDDIVLAILHAAQRVLGSDWEGRLAAFVAALRRRLTGDFEVDEFGFDPQITEVLTAAVEPLAEKWFRLEVRGIENIPAEGPVILCFGLLRPYKGIENLLEAFRQGEDIHAATAAAQQQEEHRENEKDPPQPDARVLVEIRGERAAGDAFEHRVRAAGKCLEHLGIGEVLLYLPQPGLDLAEPAGHGREGGRPGHARQPPSLFEQGDTRAILRVDRVVLGLVGLVLFVLGKFAWGPILNTLQARETFILESLEKVKDKTVVLSGLWSKSAEPPEGTTGSDHWVAAAFLTGIKPRKTAAAAAGTSSAASVSSTRSVRNVHPSASRAPSPSAACARSPADRGPSRPG